jgi:HipA-like protein
MSVQKIIINGDDAGVLKYDSEGWEFTYSDEYSSSPDATPISKQMPVTRTPYKGKSLIEFTRAWGVLGLPGAPIIKMKSYKEGEKSVMNSELLNNSTDEDPGFGFFDEENETQKKIVKNPETVSSPISVKPKNIELGQPRAATYNEFSTHVKAGKCSFCMKETTGAVLHDKCSKTLLGNVSFTAPKDFGDITKISKNGFELSSGETNIIVRKAGWNDEEASSIEFLWTKIAKHMDLCPVFLGEVDLDNGEKLLFHRNLDKTDLKMDVVRFHSPTSFENLWNSIAENGLTHEQEDKERFFNLVLFSYVFGVNQLDRKHIFRIELVNPKARTKKEKEQRISSLAPISNLYPSRYLGKNQGNCLSMPLVDGGSTTQLSSDDFLEFSKRLGLSDKFYKVFFKKLKMNKNLISDEFKFCNVSEQGLLGLQDNLETMLQGLEEDKAICKYI